MTDSLHDLRRCTLAIDLGAARTRVYAKRSGLIIDEPSLVAVDIRNGRLVAVGALAQRMTGRTAEYVRVVRPFSGGTVADVDMGTLMLRQLLGEKARRAWLRQSKPRIAAAVPFGSGPQARRILCETLEDLGARQVELVHAPLAAAVGSAIPIGQPEGSMIVICGATSTQVAVLSFGGIIAAEVLPVGGNVMDDAVMEHLRLHHALILPHQGLLPLHQVLSEAAAQPEASTEVHGKDVSSGLARSLNLDTGGVRQAMRDPLAALVSGIGRVLRRCPPDLVVDIADRGVVLTGGSAVLPGLDTMLGAATGMPVHITKDPALSTVLGLGMMIESAEPVLDESDEPRVESAPRAASQELA
ncbi:rod shape-determining protein [Streptomyces sp. H10-C2]|uniref:rod shape-determining protein n=1 Tax=unclassified Streptomyces TaxID=2593676 RepID=UPI0024BA9D8E|nr:MULTISPECIES: rod shape-determining protein [unclassified Streptomyces]MDJ0345922.1 rod shape-determining protein [Streptomyces sp. PH10-H1]MDJ0374771.1 rod shape-determining protein [Streptomyces sp. H10-C2]